MKTRWDELPALVQAAVEHRTGPLVRVEDIPSGQTSDLTAVLHSRFGRPVFLKGVEGVSRRMRFLRNEVAAAECASAVAPGVFFHLDAGDWFVVGFEYVHGRPASLLPGSPDLPVLTKVLRTMGDTSAGPTVRLLRDRWRETGWWGHLASEAPDEVAGWDVELMSEWSAQAPGHVDGDRLVHTDLHGDQFLIGDDGQVNVIDWGFPGAGAPWVDTALLVVRLISHGHESGAADQWAREVPAYADVEPEALTAFAAYLAGMWTYWHVCEGRSMPGRAAAARRFARWLLKRPAAAKLSE